MSWNGLTVLDMDAHIREAAGRFYKRYIDSACRPAQPALTLARSLDRRLVPSGLGSPG